MSHEVAPAIDERLNPAWHAQQDPAHPAVIMGASGEVVTYAELAGRSTRLALALRERGIKPGQHIAIMMENNRAYFEATWAAQRSGLYYTAVNSHLRSGEVQYILEDAEVVALITSESMADAVIALDLSSIEVRICAAGALPGFEPYDEVLASAPAGPLDDECEGQEMLYSSGTTGRPKGVRKPLSMAPMGSMEASSVQVAQGLLGRGGGPDVMYLTPAPLYHAAPLVTSMCIHRTGGTVIVMEHFDARQCLGLIERYHVNQAQFVPTMFVRMLGLPKDERESFDLSSLQMVTHAAAPCPVAVKRQMIDWWGPIIFEYYAGTEDVGSTSISSEEWLAHPGSVGRSLTPCHILSPDFTELPTGESGGIYFEGGRPFSYHNDPDKTATMTSPQGWRTLGDIGYLDADGYVYLTDRLANMIISGGVNIYPQEAENVLAGLPAVADVAVIGVPDAEMGESVKAVVQLADPSTASPDLEAELIAACRAELATYKCPRTIDFVAALPRDENGKLYKRHLRETYWAGHD